MPYKQLAPDKLRVDERDASCIVNVYNALNEDNRKLFTTVPISRMAQKALRLHE